MKRKAVLAEDAHELMSLIGGVQVKFVNREPVKHVRFRGFHSSAELSPSRDNKPQANEGKDNSVENHLLIDVGL